MNRIVLPSHLTSVEADYARWCAEQAALLREGRLSALDHENLAEEIESLGRSEKREIRNRLIRLIQHLLKWQFQPGRRSESWRSTIGEQRLFILGIIEDSPSLKRFPAEVFLGSYGDGRRLAVVETGIQAVAFPEEPPFTIDEALDESFLPGEPLAPWDVIRD